MDLLLCDNDDIDAAVFPRRLFRIISLCCCSSAIIDVIDVIVSVSAAAGGGAGEGVSAAHLAVDVQYSKRCSNGA